MNFATDRDILLLEPRVFNDVLFTAQQRLRVTDAAINGTTLTSAAADFFAAQVEPGSVALVGPDAIPIEVMARIDQNTLTVSMLRHRLTDPPIPPTLAPGSGLELIVRTFAPQATLMHDTLLAMLGLDSDEAIVSLGAMARLEALGTLERVYTAAVTLTTSEGDQSILTLKADHFRRRFRAALDRTAILLDLDDDGIADTQRRPGECNLVRV